MTRNFRRKQDEETTYWLSYSDMMAGLLLTFVIIISLTVLHAKIQYDEKQTQLMGKEQELVIQSEKLENERLTVAEQQEVLNAQEAQLTEQQATLALQQKQLGEQEQKLREQSELLKELEEVMASQQEKLDRIIGVRSELIEALKAEFDDSRLQISVNEKTGAITMDSSILFEYNKDELKESGKEFLAAFMPRYTKILMSDRYREYVSEIIIEGHTDTTGNYLFNLDLSQKRAYSVANYCLAEGSKILSPEELEALRSVITTSGRSFTDPVYKADGTVDMEASRRVEILFRLKDEEMIREMIEILNSGSGPSGQVQSIQGPGGAVISQSDPDSVTGPGVTQPAAGN